MTSATARAHPNIALVKYWGKRDEELIVPVAGSLSMTLDAVPTTTTVALADHDSFTLNGAPAAPGAVSRVAAFLDLVRARAGSDARAAVTSHNEAPTGAGLASSAAGFAALALAASHAYGLPTDPVSLSRLARRGSGSACRSIIGNLAVWNAGTGDDDSYAQAIDGPEFRMVIVTVDDTEKAVSSREAMRRTAATSPFYAGWIAAAEADLTAMIAACAAGDATVIGEITERNALRMHAVIASTEPPIRYLCGPSIAVFDAVEQLRADGRFAYATADAGPNVVVLTTPGDVSAVAAALAGHGAIRVVGPGPGACLVRD